MIQCFKIFFLSISVLFSFGFTTNQVVCDMEINMEKLCCASKKSCCDANKDIESENNCNKDCCLTSNNMLSLEDCFTEITATQRTLFVKNSILLPILLAKINILNKEEFSEFDVKFEPQYSGKKRLCYKQSWLI